MERYGSTSQVGSKWSRIGASVKQFHCFPHSGTWTAELHLYDNSCSIPQPLQKYFCYFCVQPCSTVSAIMEPHYWHKVVYANKQINKVYHFFHLSNMPGHKLKYEKHLFLYLIVKPEEYKRAGCNATSEIILQQLGANIFWYDGSFRVDKDWG